MKKVLIILLALVFLPAKAFADKRLYVWTYEYKTMEVGKAEMEWYTTFSSTDSSKTKGITATEHQIELEIGKTEKFDVAIYQVFKQKPLEGMKYDGFKVRARYKLAEKDRYFFDPLFYLEYKNSNDFSSPGYELKVILAKDTGNFNLSLKPILEIEKENDKYETEFEYSAGLSYKLNNLLNLGIEFKGSEYGNYFGPVISHGKEDLWIAIGSAFKIGTIKKDNPEFQLRTIIGIGF